MGAGQTGDGVHSSVEQSFLTIYAMEGGMGLLVSFVNRICSLTPPSVIFPYAKTTMQVSKFFGGQGQKVIIIIYNFLKPMQTI